MTERSMGGLCWGVGEVGAFPNELKLRLYVGLAGLGERVRVFAMTGIGTGIGYGLGSRPRQ
jgi:hypothetical protein